MRTSALGEIVCTSSHPAFSHFSVVVSCLPTTALTNPWLLALAIIAGTLIHEDIATVATGVLVAEGVTRVGVALPALYAGIVLGDIGLYGLGWLIARHPAARRLADRERFLALKVWLDERLVAGVFTVRFLPGMRLPAYTTYGFFTMPFWRFLGSVIFAVSIWTTGLFYVSYEFGAMTEHYLSLWQWPVIVIAMIAPLLAVERVMRGRIPTGIAEKENKPR